jgi:hypothetical protein
MDGFSLGALYLITLALMLQFQIDNHVMIELEKRMSAMLGIAGSG